jgi:hypothetical protein
MVAKNNNPASPGFRTTYREELLCWLTPFRVYLFFGRCTQITTRRPTCTVRGQTGFVQRQLQRTWRATPTSTTVRLRCLPFVVYCLFIRAHLESCQAKALRISAICGRRRPLTFCGASFPTHHRHNSAIGKTSCKQSLSLYICCACLPNRLVGQPRCPNLDNVSFGHICYKESVTTRHFCGGCQNVYGRNTNGLPPKVTCDAPSGFVAWPPHGAVPAEILVRAFFCFSLSLSLSLRTLFKCS